MFVVTNIIIMIMQCADPQMAIETFQILFLVTWGILIFWFNISILVNYIKQSGKTYKSEHYHSSVRYISLIFYIWTIAFCFKIVYISLTLDISYKNISLTEAILTVVCWLVTEIIPYVAIFEVKFIETF
jgi:hypothetical protein